MQNIVMESLWCLLGFSLGLPSGFWLLAIFQSDSRIIRIDEYLKKKTKNDKKGDSLFYVLIGFSFGSILILILLLFFLGPVSAIYLTIYMLVKPVLSALPELIANDPENIKSYEFFLTFFKNLNIGLFPMFMGHIISMILSISLVGYFRAFISLTKIPQAADSIFESNIQTNSAPNLLNK